MKKIIKRFWGVALAIVLLSSMLISVVPASAGTLSWDYANLPGGSIGALKATNPNSILAPAYWSAFGFNCVINDFAVASDGTTIYAATSIGGFKSTNGGRTWSDLADWFFWAAFGLDPTTLLTYTDRVAVAPDNPNLVVFLDTTNNMFSLSSTGGGSPHVGYVTDNDGVTANITTDVDICPKTTIHGQAVNLVLVSGASYNGTVQKPALYYLNYGIEFTSWDECITGTYSGAGLTKTFDDHIDLTDPSTATRFVTVKHSPNFVRDYVCYLVGDNGTVPSMDIVSFNSNQFNSGIASYNQYYTDNGFALDPSAPATYLDRADIVFDPNFLAGNEESRYTYVSADYHTGGNYQGGFYRVSEYTGPWVTWNLLSNGNSLITPTRAPSVWSIDVNADGSTLVAASGNGSTTWTISALKGNPNSITAVPSRLVKRSGGGASEGFSTANDNQTIAFSAAGVVLARSGLFYGNQTEGAFALSRDTGYTFNDISMVNFTLTYINDQLVNAATGIERYVVASGNLTATSNGTSVFYWDGTYWERTLTIRNDSVGWNSWDSYGGYIAGASPDDFNVLYLANKQTAMIRYTATAGRVNWLERTSPIPTTGLVDLAVQDSATLWVATDVGANGCVTKLSETGNIWPTGPPYFNAVFGTIYGQHIASLTLISPNNLVAGGVGDATYGAAVAYTMFGGAFWMTTSSFLPTTAVNVHATASGLSSGDYLYATDEATSAIYTWKLGTSLSWRKLVDVQADWTDTTQSAVDLEVYNGAMYYLSTNGTNITSPEALATSILGRALMPALNVANESEWKFQLIQYAGTTPFTQAITAWRPDSLKFSVDAALGYGNKIWITDSSGAFLGGTPKCASPYPDQIMCFTDILTTYATPILSKDEILVNVNRETGEAYNVNIAFTALPLTTYQVQVWYDRECTHFYGSLNYTNSTLYTVTKEISVGPQNGAVFPIYYQPGESYYYRIRVYSPYYSPWSEVHSLDVQPIRNPIPELYSPANGGTVPYLRPGFSWTPMGAYVQTYHFQLATSHTFSASSIVVDTNIDASTVDGAGYGLSIDLKDGTQYFWHVQVVEPFPGDWSTVANFWVNLSVATPATTQMITVPGPTTMIITQSNPPATSLTVTAPVSQEVVNPSYIWAIIIIGAVLVIAVIVLIFRTRRA